MKLRIKRKVGKSVYGHIWLFFHMNSFFYETRKIYPLAAESFFTSPTTSLKRRTRITKSARPVSHSDGSFCSSPKSRRLVHSSRSGTRETAFVHHILLFVMVINTTT